MNVVAIGAHPDDIELGAGGALALHKECGDSVYMLVLTKGGELSDPSTREEEAHTAHETLDADDVRFLGFEDTQVPYNSEIVKQIEDQIQELDADRVYIHTQEDTHQDHQRAAKASVSATRNCDVVLAFESPSTRPSFAPQYYIPLTESLLDRKLQAIKDHKSQQEKKYLEAEAMSGLARFRGRQANTRYAEAFQVVRIQENVSGSPGRQL
jgi:LmbE family N-acetylglucosaminyl deacetylase